MPVLTQLAGTTITGTIESPVVTLPPTSVLNSFGAGQPFDSYRVQDDATGANTVAAGEFLTPVFEDTPVPGEDTPLPGTYLGSGVLSTAGLGIGNPTGGFLSPNLGLNAQINPVDVDYFRDGDGNVYFITDEPLTADRLLVTVTVKLPGLAGETVTVPLSDLSDTIAGLDPTGVLGVIVPDITSLTQSLLDTALISTTINADGTLVLPDEEIEIVCFARGTMIDTPDGPVAVQDLRAGDLVVTRDNGPQPVRWMGSQRLSADMLARNPRLTPVRIAAGALGVNSPSHDLIVSPQHRVLVQSRIAQRMFGTTEVLVAAKQLLSLDGFDLATDLAEVEYFHIMFDQHEVIRSNGADTESLYTGEQALRMVGAAAREELLTLFPDLADMDQASVPARDLPQNRMVRKMADRHQRNSRMLVG
ncbi:Hint domain-containing protein [Paracoccus sp. Ld10]|uniref:Hint domain-containing protein n=1 Tax=Paracoccus sp. Ld10 TaxID=649158 RepID=UPI00386A12FE